MKNMLRIFLRECQALLRPVRGDVFASRPIPVRIAVPEGKRPGTRDAS